MSAPVFVDTNVLLYAADAAEADMQRKAAAWRAGAAALATRPPSYQVLQEFYVQAVRKNPKRSEAARAEVRDLSRLGAGRHRRGRGRVRMGILQERFSLSFGTRRSSRRRPLSTAAFS